MSEQASNSEQAPLAESNSDKLQSERHVLTALSYDLIGSTELLAALDIEDFQDLMSAFQFGAKQAITSNAGVMMVEAGDGGLALFPTDMDSKDAASLAVRAGLAIVAACERLGREKDRSDLHVRVGIATSLILIQHGQHHSIPKNVAGAALAMATRLQSVAGPDLVFVSDETRNLVRRSHAFAYQGARVIKGFASPQQVWRALRHRREVDRFFAFGRLEVQLLGREPELRTIAGCWSKVVTGEGQALLIEGEAGIGKSRLVHEIRSATRFQRAKLLLFQCQPGGLRSTLHPLLQNISHGLTDGGERLTASDIARQFRHQGIADPDVIGIFSFLLGADGSSQPLKEAGPDVIREKAGWAVRQCIAKMCSAGPLVLVVEDIHWIDPTSRQLLIDLSKLIHEYPVFLVVTARIKAAVRWLEAPDMTIVTLNPLDSQNTRLAIRSKWPEGSPQKLPELLDMIERVTGGVPLFIEEVCQWMSENAESAQAALARKTSPSHVSVFENVIEARLEQKGPARDVARAASVAGNRFDQKLLAELLPQLDVDSIGVALDSLGRSGFVTEIKSSGAPAYAFRHALIRETIYNGLLKKQRREFHHRLFAGVQKDPDIAAWVGTGALADHAERAGLLEDAIELFVSSGIENSSRSAMVEARQLLEHALELCDQIRDPGQQDALRLSAMAALGPVLTSTEGPSSPPARKLYDDGVGIARRRPLAERAKWFPIYWGWWFTGADVDGERAHAVLKDLKDVEDPEVQLQARHCVWAIDFYLGRHDSCISAVNSGLSLYGTRHRARNATLFGGHDAKVCGLSHRGLSQWFTGRVTEALQSLSEAKSWALQDGHIGSIAHVYNNCAMLSCYRRDFTALRHDILDIRTLTSDHHLPSLAATSQILEGWSDGIEGDTEQGRDKIRQGLASHNQLQTPEDYPVYCSFLAEIMERTGEFGEALGLLGSAAVIADKTGHRYWIAELHRRRAHILLQLNSDGGEILGAIEQSLSIAAEQNAIPILLSSYDTLVTSGLSRDLVAYYSGRIDAAKVCLDPNEPLFVNPEEMLIHEHAR